MNIPPAGVLSPTPANGKSMSSGVHSPPAAEAIAGNEDLLTQVLSFLPVRSLFRFKSVSKQWLNLISDRRFWLLHSRLHRNARCSALLFYHHSPSSVTSRPCLFDFIPLRANDNRSTPPPFITEIESTTLTILQSCNGLLLLRCIIAEMDDDFGYFVCNPTIKQILQLPAPDEVAVGNQSVLGIYLAFDPEKSAVYKLVCVWLTHTDEVIWLTDSDEVKLGVDVYSSEIDQWRRSIDWYSEVLPLDLEFEEGVYCDGKIHWLSHTESSVFFDLESERIRTLPLPPRLEACIVRFRYFGESMGHLHLVEILTNDVSEFNELELDNETLLWSVKYRVNLDAMGRQFDEMVEVYYDRSGLTFRCYAFSILAVARAERDEDSTLVLSIPGKVISYNFETGFTDLRCECKVGDPADGIATFDDWVFFKGLNAYQFFETLYPL